jgi:hypothetical protein
VIRVLVVATSRVRRSRVRRKEEDFLIRRWRRCWPERRTTEGVASEGRKRIFSYADGGAAGPSGGPRHDEPTRSRWRSTDRKRCGPDKIILSYPGPTKYGADKVRCCRRLKPRYGRPCFVEPHTDHRLSSRRLNFVSSCLSGPLRARIADDPVDDPVRSPFLHALKDPGDHKRRRTA